MVESELLIKLAEHYPKPLMISSLLLIQFKSMFTCYETLTALKLNPNACHEAPLRSAVRDFKNKQSLLEMQEAPLSFKAQKLQRIEFLEGKKHKVKFAPNGLIKSVTYLSEDLIP